MATTRRIRVREYIIRLDDNGTFIEALRIGQIQWLEDGVIEGRRSLDPDLRTLAQIKADVQALT